MCDDEGIERENSEERINKSGVGAGLVRKMALERVQPRLNAFCTHGSLADIIALDAALELAEDGEWSFHRAVVIESLLTVLRAEPILNLGCDNADCRKWAAGASQAGGSGLSSGDPPYRNPSDYDDARDSYLRYFA